MSRRTLAINCALLLAVCLPAAAQTSISCSSAAYCGNQILRTGDFRSSSNKDVWLGVPLAVTGSFTLSQWNISMRTVPAGTHIIMVLVCDSNTSGTTIGNSSPCPSNNIVCSLSSTLNPPATADDTFTASGCGALSSSARYWVFQNTDNSGLETYLNDPGASPRVNAYFASAICCTIPGSFTGAVANTSQPAIIGVTLTTTANPSNPSIFVIAP